MSDASGVGAEAPNEPVSNVTVIEEDLRGILHSKLMPGLDALRVIAVSLVLAEHFHVFQFLTPIHPFAGAMGVTIFFVLSGFLITWMLLKEYNRTGAISLGSFYRRRTFRIFPSFYVCWTLTTLVEYIGHRLEWLPAIVSFFYFMDYGLGLHPQWSTHHMWISWSLAVEEKFYLLWPLLLIFLLRKRSALIRNLSLIILALWVYRAVLFLGSLISLSHLQYTFEMRADALLVGCLTAIVLDNDRGRRLFCSVLRWQWLSILPAAILAISMATVYPYSNPYLLLPVWTIHPVIIAIMLVQFIYWGSKSWTICNTAAMRFGAHLSYALYLYHPLASEITVQLHASHRGFPAAILTIPMGHRVVLLGGTALHADA